MKNNSYLTYHAPKFNFEMIPNKVVDKFDADLVGIYCKLVYISSGKTMKLDWLAKKIGIGQKKLRKSIVAFEEAGYIVRKAVRDEKGHISGWNYQLFSEPVDKNKRSCAGKKIDDNEDSNLDKNGQVGEKPNLTKTNQVGNGKDNIIYNNDVINNIEEDFINKEDKESTNVDEKPTELSLFGQSEEEKKFISYMRENFPRIMKMQKPLTLEEAKKLKKEYGDEMLYGIMQDAENYKPLLKNYVSANLVLRKWCSREREKA